MDDLQHRATLVGTDARREVAQHGDAARGQVARPDVVGGVDGERPPSAFVAAVSKESDSAATVIPRPSMPGGTRSARCACTPCDVTAPAAVTVLTASATVATPGAPASASTRSSAT